MLQEIAWIGTVFVFVVLMRNNQRDSEMVVIRDSNGNSPVTGDAPPSTLGKFLDAEGAIASLKEETVKFTPPNQLNDEWDCIPFRYKSEDIERLWNHTFLSQLFPEQKQYFFEKYVNRDWASLKIMLSNHIGIASFTDLRSCDLSWMWDHYGGRHKGCAVVFDTSKMGRFFKVEYREKRPDISIPIYNDMYPVDEVLAVLTTKEMGTADHWEKEFEWRMIGHLSGLIPMGTVNGAIYLKSYPGAFIKVVCGCAMNNFTFNTIKEMAGRRGISVEREGELKKKLLQYCF